MLDALTIPPATILNRAAAPVIARSAAEAKASAGAAVSIRGLQKRYGDKPVLAGIDLDFEAGEFVAIVGRSGCGKSTLLRLLLGLEEPDAGEIRIAGAAAPRAGGDVARFIFQEPRLLPWERVLDNVALGASRAVPADRRRPLAQEALKEVGLGDRGGEWPSVLSGGQRQRVALRAPSSAIRACSPSTSRSARSTPSPGSRCRASWSACGGTRASRRSSSRTTSRRPSPSPTASC